MNDEQFKQIESLIKDKKNILLLTHSKIDGDALGSILSMYLFLKKLNKEVTAVCEDPIPNTFKFLPTTEVLNHEFSGSKDFIVTLDAHHTELDSMKYTVENNKVNIIISTKKGALTEKDISFKRGTTKYDLIIALDTPSLEQLGSLYENDPDIFFTIPIINIDHHISNTHFGQINYIVVTASSTTEILFNLFQFLQKEKNLIDKDMATLLLAGIITDTGSFQNANTTPKSLEIAADLFDLGADQQEIIKNIYKTKKLSTLKLWGRVLSKLKNDPIHRIVWSIITQQDFIDTHSTEEDTGDIIDELMSNAPGTEIFLLLKEQKNGTIAGSLRTSTPEVNASKIAAMFDGGGHVQASGFKVKGETDIHQATYKIIDQIRDFQKERLGIDKTINYIIPQITELVIPQENITKKADYSAQSSKESFNINQSEKKIIDITEKLKEIKEEENNNS